MNYTTPSEGFNLWVDENLTELVKNWDELLKSPPVPHDSFLDFIHFEFDRELDDYDPTPWCNACGSTRQQDCHCGPIASNE